MQTAVIWGGVFWVGRLPLNSCQHSSRFGPDSDSVLGRQDRKYCDRRREPQDQKSPTTKKVAQNSAAANVGVTNGGLRRVWLPFLEIGRNRSFSPFLCLFRPFLDGAESAWEIQKTEEKDLFPQISSDLLKPTSLKPPFAALQQK